MRLIVPMGGRGTRLRPFSHTTPKALLPLAGKPVIARILDGFARSLHRPIEEVVFVLSPEAAASDVPAQLAAACAPLGVRGLTAIQEAPLGTAHAIHAAGDYLAGEVLTIWSDTLFYADASPPLDDAPDLVAWTMHIDDPRRFGIAERDATGRVVRLVEKPTEPRSTETLIGAYYVRDGASLRAQIGRMLRSGQTGAGGEYQLTDALDALVQAGQRMETTPVRAWLDVGTVEAYLDTLARVLDEEGRGEAPSGVTVRPPVYIAPDATVEASTVGPHASVEAGAVVRGSALVRTAVFGEATVTDAALTDAAVGHRARVTGYAGRLLLGDDGVVEGRERA